MPKAYSEEVKTVTTEPIIELEKIGYKTGYRYLLQDVSWNIREGEHWVVFGMNGSGKTTLLSIITGYKHYTEGKMKVFGNAVTADNVLDIRKKIGWVSASFFDKYYSKESALHIVLSGKSGALGMDDTITLDDVRYAKELLEELQLGDRINHTFDMLSKGQRQNVLIARALFGDPEILILDEPCTGLDIYNRNYLFRTLEALSKRKKLTILYVTHYVEEILPIFDKTLLLRNGHIFAKGNTDELMTGETMSTFFGYDVDVQNVNGTYNLTVQSDASMIDLLMRGNENGRS